MSHSERTIDFATSASIDMMSLNNKVVNMRQVVKRTKVQVVNKLCKNITALKKKKGTDDQKAQNLRKAQRFIEEIDSIKHLKEDKVSKYALANTVSFKDVCKASLSAGVRALARLTDHPLMQKVVGDFRTQHPDWKDLAAYLLVKQTGRRFKTKKQKQRKKLARSVANINASETMTKAYIQERFGEDGLKKAEQRFERKRKRAPHDEKLNSDVDGDDEFSKESKSKKAKEGIVSGHTDVVEKEEEGVNGEDKGSDEEASENENSNDEHDVDSEEEYEHLNITDSNRNFESKELSIKKSTRGKCLKIKKGKEKEEDNDEQSEMSQSVIKAKLNSVSDEKIDEVASGPGSSSNDESMEGVVHDSHTKEKRQSVLSKKSECVVKEIEIDKTDNILSEEESSAETSNEDGKEEAGTNSDSDASAKEVPRIKKKAKSKVPSILTNKPQKPMSDPFFADSDDEGEAEDMFNDFDEALLHDADEDNDGGGVGGTRSMFYNPQGDIYRKGVKVPARGFSSHRGGGRWQRQERGRGRGGGRGSIYPGSQRRRGRSFGGTRGREDRGKSRGQGSPGDWVDSKRRFDNREKPWVEHVTSTSKPAPASSSEKLHPSWEASKKRKAEQSGIQAFKGSKITFDDDD